MKPPQRRFTVEYKSGRRQPKTQATSIWGNVDLQALAREIEGQSSHLFGANRPVVQEGTASAATSSELISAQNTLGEEIAFEAPSAPVMDSADGVASISADLPEIAEPAPVDTELPIGATDKLARKMPRKRFVRTSKSVSKAADERQEASANPEAPSVSVDELTVLDAENKRLRLLLVNQLRAENAELERMLKRY